MVYEHAKHDGSLPLIGVNTFTSSQPAASAEPTELARATEDEKRRQLARLRDFQERHAGGRESALDALRDTVLTGENMFGALMEAVRHATLGEISGPSSRWAGLTAATSDGRASVEGTKTSGDRPPGLVGQRTRAASIRSVSSCRAVAIDGPYQVRLRPDTRAVATPAKASGPSSAVNG